MRTNNHFNKTDEDLCFIVFSHYAIFMSWRMSTFLKLSLQNPYMTGFEQTDDIPKEEEVGRGWGGVWVHLKT